MITLIMCSLVNQHEDWSDYDKAETMVIFGIATLFVDSILGFIIFF